MSNIYFLYLKQCNHCDKLYFGKTDKINPFSYSGSGIHWCRHLKKHKTKHVTLDIWGFDDEIQRSNFAIDYSNNHNIVESKEYFNKIPEDGLKGGKLHSGKVSVKDKNDNTLHIDIKDFDKSKYSGVVKGTIPVRDKDGNSCRVSKDDPRYLNGELVQNRRQMVYAKDSLGKIHWVHKNDPRIKERLLEFLHTCPNNAKCKRSSPSTTATDKQREASRKNGKVAGKKNLGRKHSKEIKEAKAKSRQEYFDKKLGKKTEKEFSCPTCSSKIIKILREIPNKHYFCNKSCSVKFARKNQEKLTCPYCKIEAFPSNYKTYHGENCRFK